MAYESSNFNSSDHTMRYSAEPDQLDSYGGRARAPSRVPGEENHLEHDQPSKPHHTVDEAATSAASKTEPATYVAPELIAQITASVITQLKTSGMDGGTAVPSQHIHYPPPPPPPVHQPVPSPPSSVSASSPPMHSRKVYTPPSPHKHPAYSGHGSPPPQPTYTQPAPANPDPLAAPAQGRRASSPFSQADESSYVRPKGPTRLSTSKEETTLEKIWGQLFDEEGNPTARLGQLLRGLAVHIIEDFEPENSIVITPSKMLNYYEAVKLPNELYPWPTVFDDERSKISRLYRELGCQHHLVQERNDEKPDIPALTPVGFERWMTLMIQAHPNEEYERLQKTVLDMPISNPDERKERFPKECSRRLFPVMEDRQIQGRIERAISEHADIDLPIRSHRDRSPYHRPSVGTESVHRPSNARPSAAPDMDFVPPTHRRERSVDVESTSIPAFVGSSLERERAPYSNIPVEAIIDDTNPLPMPSQPLERERKPYSAVPGVGKAYEDEGRGWKPRSESNASKVERSNSTKHRTVPVGLSGPRSVETPKPEIHQHRRAPSNTRRPRSPSFSRVDNDFRRSESDLRSFPAAFQASSGPPGDMFNDDTRRYPRPDHYRRQADEDTRLYGEGASSRSRYDRGNDINTPARGPNDSEEEYYRNAGRHAGNVYGHSQQSYGGPYR